MAVIDRYLRDNYRVVLGDSRRVLRKLPRNSVDAVVCDPPYELSFMGKGWDGTGIAHDVRFWRLVYRVLKPGGHVVAFGGTRTYHRMTCAIEDAGFEIRDMLTWVYGSGFPKSLNVEKAINKMYGVKFARQSASGVGFMNKDGSKGYNATKHRLKQRGSSHKRANKWKGYGTALKPSLEPICFARKPLSEKNVATNVLRWETGAINIDACKVETGVPRPARSHEKSASGLSGNGGSTTFGKYAVRGSVSVGETMQGRWPANLCHDGSDEVVDMFPHTTSGTLSSKHNVRENKSVAMSGKLGVNRVLREFTGSSGSSARFFYSAKTSKRERHLGLRHGLTNTHPTVKPVALMRWLVRLVTPSGGCVLDPFTGSGSTGIAARNESLKFFGVEKEEEYYCIARRRIRNAHLYVVQLKQIRKSAIRRDVSKQKRALWKLS